MFAKRSKQSSQQQPRRTTAAKPHSPGSTPRDATIERLERELASSAQLAQTLREALDAATFKADILEKSYAKQLADARDKRAAIEAELKKRKRFSRASAAGTSTRYAS